MIILTESQPPQQGKTHSVIMSPKPKLGCDITWTINGQVVDAGDEVGGLKVNEIKDDRIVVTPTGDFEQTTISVYVNCPDNTGDSGGPLTVGSGTTDPCEKDPCKSARLEYLDAIGTALVAQNMFKSYCTQLRAAIIAFYTILGIFFVTLAAFMSCSANPVFPALCSTLFIAFNIIATLLSISLIYLSSIYVFFRKAQVSCHGESLNLSITHLKMTMKCPKRCQIKEVKIDCECKGK